MSFRPVRTAASRATPPPRAVAAEVVEAPEEGDDAGVIDVRVAVDEDVAEPHGGGEGAGEVVADDGVGAESADGVGVRLRRRPPLGDADVVGDAGDPCEGGDEPVLHRREEVGVALDAGAGETGEGVDVGEDPGEETDDPLAIDHGR